MERKHYILYRNPLIAILVSVTFIFASALPIFLETNQVQSAQTIFFDLPSKLAVNQSTDPTIRDSLKELFIEANLFLTKNATSVTEKTELPASGNIHDFLSLAPYCWPDPTKSNGLPYICRDGMVNPEVQSIPDGRNMGDMIVRVKTLSLAYYFSDNKQYASKAAELLRVWFLNNDSRMNPNLEFAEMVRGLNNGTAHGIIAGKYLPDIVDSIGLIQNSSAWSEKDQQGIELWFATYFDWLLNSNSGKKESESKNNQGTWYDVQVSSIALFLNKTDLAKHILKTNELPLIGLKIEPDGRQPYELVRQTSLGYSILNLLGLFKLAIIGEHLGFDLWNYQTPQGAGLQKALNYLLPYVSENQTWPYAQIRPPGAEENRNSIDLLCQATIHYQKNESYIEAYKSVNRQNLFSSWDNLIYMCGETRPN